ncbi:MAG: hypothetical protein WD824_15260, partial [Cyclobacteriaceae bacterium]
MYRLSASVLFVICMATACTDKSFPQYNGLKEDMLLSKSDSIVSDKIVYHQVRVDEKGHILPWYSANPGQSYDHVLGRVWNFWKNLEVDSNGMQYYMNHQVWQPGHDKRGLGGDQLNMALSSWDLYYNYTGDESVIENMRYMADYYLANSLSPSTSKWPDIPYPYNMDVESGIYDGDMIIGKGYTQPDKAGSFAFELIHLYKKTGEERYLNTAIKIANTLASKVQPGDNDNSPWPFKVNAETGEVGVLIEKATWYEGMDKDLSKNKEEQKKSSYTTFFTGTLNLFRELIEMKKGNTAEYKKAFDMTINWFKAYPVKTNKWGPFFEDVPRWSDTQINAITYAMFIMENPDLDPQWKETVKGIFKWVYDELGNDKYSNYGVVVIDEQTAYRVPGNSHSARQASMDLMYWEKSGDTTYARNAVRQLNWATYMVDADGKNFYPTNAIWMTDGYGDYVRHYLRAMAAAPQLAPDNADHLLRTSSIVSKIEYKPARITYTTFDNASNEVFRLTGKPSEVLVNGEELDEVEKEDLEGWTWQGLDNGGIL